MSIPDYQTLMLPLPTLAGHGREHSKREGEVALAQHFQLTEEERATLLPSVRQRLFDNRVGWARSYWKVDETRAKRRARQLLNVGYGPRSSTSAK